MAEQTISLGAGLKLNVRGFERVTWPNKSFELDTALTVRSTPDVAVRLTRIVLDFGFDPARLRVETANGDLSDAYEGGGLLTFTHGTTEFAFAVGGRAGARDAATPYDYTLTADEETAAFAFWGALPSDASGATLTISDAAVPDDAAPTLPPVADKAGNVGTDVDVTLPAATAGHPAPTYSVSGLPDGLAFAPGTRRITGTPTTEETATVTYKAANSEGTASVDFDWTIGPRLAAPVLAAVADKAGNVGTEVDVTLPAATAGHPAPTYSVSGLPDGLAFAPGTRRITGTPARAQTATVTYEATNSQGSASVEFDWTVTHVPRAPTLAAVAGKAGNVGTRVNVTLPAATAGHPAPTYSVSGLPDGLAFAPGTRRITGTPTTEETATVTYKAANSEGTASVDFDWTIGPRLAAPVLAAVADRTGTVGTEVDVTLPAATAGHPAPTYSVSGLPAGLIFDADTRRITGTLARAQTATVTYEATNTQGTASVDFDWTVTPVPRAPKLPAVADMTGNVGSRVNVTLPAATAGHPAPTYSVSGLPDGLAFAPGTRRITGTPTTEETATVTYKAANSEGTASVDFDWTIGPRLAAPVLAAVADKAGNVGTEVDVTLPAATAGHPAPTYSVSGLPDGLAFAPGTRRITGTPARAQTATVTYEATNSQGSASVEFDWTVTHVPRAPTLAAVAGKAGNVGTRVNVTLPAATAGHPAPTYSVSGLPDGLAFAPGTRRITGTPTTEETATVTYKAANSEGTASVDFDWTIGPRLAAPVLAAVADRTGTVGTEVDVTLPAATAGHPAPTYSVSGLPAGLIFDADTRRITGTLARAQTATVTYEATNTQGTASVDFDWTVTPVPRAPKLPAVADMTGNVGSRVNVTLPAATAGHPAPTYSVSGLPDGLAFAPGTRRITGTPTTEETATVTYKAANSEGTASVDFDWTIGPRLAAPVLAAVADRTGTVGTEVDVTLPAATAGHPAPTYSVSGLPDGLAFAPGTRRITGTPARAQTATVTYEATNSQGSASVEFDWTVRAPITRDVPAADAFRAELYARHSDEALVTLLTLRIARADGSVDVVRLTDAPAGIRSRGQDYAGQQMAAGLPSVTEGGSPMLRLELDAVDRDVARRIRQLVSGTADIEVALSSTPDAVRRSWEGMSVDPPQWDLRRMTLPLRYESSDREPYPAPTMTPDTVPGAF